MKVLTFTALYPNAIQRNHGVFVRERLRRLRASMGFDHAIIAPLPWFPRLPGFGRWSDLARVPRRELDEQVELHHPRYLKVPGLGLDQQARAMARGSRRIFQRVLAGGRIALVDAHYLYPDAVAAGYLAEQAGLPIVVSARGSDVNLLCEEPGPREQIRALLRRARAVCAVSRALCKRLGELEPRCLERLHHVPNGVDLERFQPGSASAARAVLGLDPKGAVLLYVGRLVRTKGLLELIEALAALREPSCLIVVGSGPAREVLRAEVARRRLGERVTLAGEIDHAQLPVWYRAADRFVLPSYAEGHPNVVCEALACGLPIVATEVGGIPEIVAGSCGILVPVGEPPGTGLAGRLAHALAVSLQARYDPGAMAAARSRLGWAPTLATLGEIFSQAADS